jgi:hypothetical protein
MNALTRTEVIAALEKNQRRIRDAVSRLKKPLTDEEWQYVQSVIIELRRIQMDLEEQLKSTAE